jgi:NAD(P)-dependent dehydrogenase (short-subunit alcohol dehydrogenase family)
MSGARTHDDHDGDLPGEGARILWVSGAGSGVGRGTAVAAARDGWRLVLSGRRVEALEGTRALVEAAGSTAVVAPLDVTDDAALAAVVAGLDRLDGVVVAAGLNAPRRSWADQDLADFDRIVATNLTGPAHQVAAALPLLRASGGTVVLVSSYAAWTHSPGAGVAYSASKTRRSCATSTRRRRAAGSAPRTSARARSTATSSRSGRPSPTPPSARRCSRPTTWRAPRCSCSPRRRTCGSTSWCCPRCRSAAGSEGRLARSPRSVLEVVVDVVPESELLLARPPLPPAGVPDLELAVGLGLAAQIPRRRRAHRARRRIARTASPARADGRTSVPRVSPDPARPRPGFGRSPGARPPVPPRPGWRFRPATGSP